VNIFDLSEKLLDYLKVVSHLHKLFMYLRIYLLFCIYCSLLDDATSDSDHVASNERMIVNNER
jgi:uncharacterized membrane protein